MRHHNNSTRRRNHGRGGLRATVLTLLTLGAVALPGTAQAADPTSSATSSRAWVRVGHFVPGMGSTSVELEPQNGGARITLAPDAAYGDVSAYEKVAPGTYTATVQDTSSSASAPLLSRTVEIAADDARTIAVIGTSDQPRLALLTDDLTPPPAGTARVRLLSASPGAGAVDVQAVGGPALAEQAVPGQATDYVTVPAGSWTLQLSGGTTTADLQDVPVTSGSIYTVVVLDTDDEDPSGVRLQVVTDAAGAVTMPQGGAATGEGGTAPTQSATSAQSLSRALFGSLAAMAVGGAALLISQARYRCRPGRVC